MTVPEHLHIAIQTARAAATAELAERRRPQADPDSGDDAGLNNDTAPARPDVLALLSAPAELVVSARVLPPSDASPTQINEIGDTSTLG